MRIVVHRVDFVCDEFDRETGAILSPVSIWTGFTRFFMIYMIHPVKLAKSCENPVEGAKFMELDLQTIKQEH
jgi:hypothetical protein